MDKYVKYYISYVIFNLPARRSLNSYSFQRMIVVGVDSEDDNDDDSGPARADGESVKSWRTVVIPAYHNSLVRWISQLLHT